MENIVHTLRLPAPASSRRASSVPTGRRPSRTSFSSGRSRRKRDPNFTEEDELELFKLSVMGWGGQGGETAKREEEDIKRKLAAQRKPSRKISREGDFVVIE